MEPVIRPLRNRKEDEEALRMFQNGKESHMTRKPGLFHVSRPQRVDEEGDDARRKSACTVSVRHEGVGLRETANAMPGRRTQ